MRAALYARFSTDLQNPSSIDDQLAGCRRDVERHGDTLDPADVFTDAAITGKSRVGRPGLAALVAAAKAGRFDVVVCEALDRLTRAGGDAWDLYDELKFAGVTIRTLADGVVGTMHIGFKGTVGALELEATALRVRRGMRGVAGQGRYPAAPPYGYRALVRHDARGERIKGLIEHHPEQADVVRRIAAEYLAGSTASAIAHRLNAEGVAGPKGGPWTAAAMVGARRAQRGVLLSPLYGGEIVWNRLTRLRDRKSGATRTVRNAEADLVRYPAPQLAIHDPDTWAQLAAEIERRAALVSAAGNPSAANAPKRLFSGLVKCGLCGGGMGTVGKPARYRCLARTLEGPHACDMARTPVAADLEAAALAQLRADLLHPDNVELFVREYRAAMAARTAGQSSRRAQAERELAETEQRAGRLVDQVADGLLSGPTVAGRLQDLEAQAERLRAELADLGRPTADVVPLKPNAADRYREIVDNLTATLDRLEAAEAQAADHAGAERDAARAELRKLITGVIVHPGDARGEWRVEIDDALANLFGLPAAASTLKLSRRA